MKPLFYLVVSLLLCGQIVAYGQSAITLNGAVLTVNSANMHINGGLTAVASSTVTNNGQLVITGSLYNASSNGNLSIAGAGWCSFRGSSNATISNTSTGSLWLNYLDIDKSASAEVWLDGGLLRIGSVLRLTNGSVFLNGQGIDMNTDAKLQGETGGRRVYDTGNGYIKGTGTVNAPTANDVFGLGFVASSPANWGLTELTRWHNSVMVGPYTGIKRRYHIEVANNNSLNADLKFLYLSEETLSQDENSFVIWKSSDNITWNPLTSNPNPSNGWVTATGIQSFSFFTLSDANNPLPVTWLYFQAMPDKRGGSALQWGTAHWEEADYFNIEHSADGISFETIGRKEAIYTPQPDYRFWHKEPHQGIHYYRLKQYDRDGSYAYSVVVSIDLNAPINQPWVVFPNPASKGNDIFFTGDIELSTWELWTTAGQLVATGEWKSSRFKCPTVPTGIYLLKFYQGQEPMGVRTLYIR